MQKKFAKEWSGKKLDDALMKDMRKFLKTYGWIQDPYGDMGARIQNYKWIFRIIYLTGINPYSESCNVESFQNSVKIEGDSIYQAERINQAEKEYLDSKFHLEYPITLSYFPAYDEIIKNSQIINIMLVFFAVSISCGIFSEDRSRKVRTLVLTTRKGHGKDIFTRILSGITVTAGTAFLLYGITFVVQFGLLGCEGFTAPIQLLPELVGSRLNLKAGEAVIILCFTSILITCVMTSITLLLSELFQNVIPTIAIPYLLLLISAMFHKPIYSYDRKWSQIWQFFPLQRVSKVMLYDERMVQIGNHLFSAIIFSIGLYLLISVLGFGLCGILAYIRRKDRH